MWGHSLPFFGDDEYVYLLGADFLLGKHLFPLDLGLQFLLNNRKFFF